MTAVWLYMFENSKITKLKRVYYYNAYIQKVILAYCYLKSNLKI